jgi:diaminopimelate decarboxylase
VALAAGVPADRLVLHGNNKSDDELRRALEVGVGRIVVDSFDELDRLDQLVPRLGATPPKVLLRVTPGIEAHTHEYVQTGQDDSKFGFTLSTGLAAEAVARATASPSVDLVGIHVHIGSQVFVADFFRAAVEAIAEFFNPLGLDELSIGGGIGVAYVESEEAPSITEWAEAVHAAARAAGITARITAEPGRAIAAAAAVTVYRVGTIKDLPGLRTYVSVDGGISDNPRPVLYGSGYEAFLARAVDADRPRPVRVVGKHCESGDLLVREAFLPADAAVGDLLVTPVTGAYGHSMASNYNKVPRPAVVFVAHGVAREVVRRETLDDLLRLDTT